MELTIYDRFKVRTVKNFTEFSVNLEYDKFGSTFSFTFLFEPFNPEHKELACEGHYHTCKVTHEGEILVKGFALTQTFSHGPAGKLCTITGYSMPGLYEDCNIPPDLYPLQSDGVSLLTIANKLTKHWKDKYGIEIEVDPEVADLVNKPFKKSTASDTDTIAEYLRKMATQKKVIISHNDKGYLLFTKAKTKMQPILEFDQTKPMIPGTEFEQSFNGQGIHSHIYVQRQASIGGGNAGYFMIRNPYCPVLYRPKVVSQSSGDDVDTEEVANRELAAELENITLTINTDRWSVNGKIIRPNNTISIIDPYLYLYTKSTWFIRSVNLVGNEKETTATLNCVVPEVVNGEYPKSFFAGINMHP